MADPRGRAQRALAGAAAALVLPAFVAAVAAACGAPGQPCLDPLAAEAGDDQYATEGFLVRLAGTQEGAANPSFRWAQVDGPVVELLNATTATASFRAPSLQGAASAAVVLRLQVSDGNRTSRPDYVTVHVLPAGSGPIADAGGTVEALVGERVVLDGSRSRMVDGRPLRFEWRQLPAANDIFVALDGADTAVASFTAPNATNALSGGMHFRLRVWDDVGASEDEAVVVVRAPTPAPAPRFTFTVAPAPGGANVTFTAAAGTENATWTFPDGSTAQGLVVTRHLPPGTHEVTLRAGEGPQAVATTERVTVSPASVNPSPGTDAWLPWAVAGAAVVAAAALAGVLLLRKGRPKP